MSNLENDLVDGTEGMTEDDDLDVPQEMSSADSTRILEAILFASDELITTARLKAILPGNPDAREIGRMVEKINRQLQNERHPFEIVEIGGGYQFKTVAFYHPWVRQIFKEKASKRLSIQALECLSIIAYRQPISKAEVEAIRGVLSDGAMKTLLEKRLVTITGRSEKPGRPLLYGTTPEFLKYFGLNKISDLPKIEEFEAMVREKMEGMGIDELKNVQSQAQQEAAEEATIEVAIPQNAAETADATPLAPAGDAGVFEVTMEEAPSAPSVPEEKEPVMEAETVLQPAIKDEPAAPARADDTPIVTVKKKKTEKKHKKSATITAANVAPAPPSDEEDTVFEAKSPSATGVDVTAETSVDHPAPATPEPDAAVFDIGAANAGTSSGGKNDPDAADDAVFEVKL